MHIAKGSAQDISTLSKQLYTVETGKYTFRQELKDFGNGLFNYSVTQVDSKGREAETQYNFSFADIDVNTIRALTKKDLILVQMLVSGKQKLIQVVQDGGDKISYASEFDFLATDSENGNVLEGILNGLVPKAVELDEKRLSLNGYNAHLKWLLDNIGDVELPKKQIVQKATTDQDVKGKLVLEQTFNAKSNSKSELSELNLAILNPNSIGYRVSGDEFTITAETRRGISGIRYVEDGEQKNYQKTIKLYAKSITNGKDIFKVLRAAVPLAEEAFENSQPNVASNDAALQFLNSTIASVEVAEETLTQNLTIQENVAQFKLTETKPDESTTNVYRFNFSDINANNIDYDGQKDRLFVLLPTKKSVNFLQDVENGELQNYTDNVKIYFNTIEDAVVGAKALKALSAIYEKKMDGTSYATTSSSTAVDQLKKILKKVKIGEDSYDMFIELTDPKTHTVKITTVFSNLKKSEETVKEFSLKDINPKNCKIEVKGKHVIAELNTNHLEKIVKTYVDGEIKPYQFKVEIECLGIEEARQVVGIIESISEKINL